MANRLARNLVIGTFIVVLLALYVVLAGPYFPISPLATPEIERAVLAAPDLDQYLQLSEKKIAGVKLDLSKFILWDPSSNKDDEEHAKTPLAFVYIHGFSSSRGELSPVVERLAARFHANAYFTRLTGHAMADGEGFATVTAQDWIKDAREALAIGRRLGKRIVLVGTSTGGALALDLAYENVHQSDIAALILISPNFRPSDWRSRFISGPLGPWLARAALGDHLAYRASNKLHDYRWTTKYRAEGIAAMMDLVNYVDGLDLKRLQAPTLVLYTHNDRVVNLDLIRSKYLEIGAPVKRIVDLPKATQHVLAGDAMGPDSSEGAIQEIGEFVQEQAIN